MVGSEARLIEMTFYCTVCRNPIPDDRADRNGVTCSEACSKQRRAIKRDRKRRKGVCDTCGRRWGQKRPVANLQPCSKGFIAEGERKVNG